MSDGANGDTAATEEHIDDIRNATDVNHANEDGTLGLNVTQEQAAASEDAVTVSSNEETPSDVALGMTRSETPVDEPDNNASTSSFSAMENNGTHNLDENEQERQEEEGEESGVPDERQNAAKVVASINMFLKAHKEWRIRKAILNKETSDGQKGRIAILNAMTTSTPVELHSLKTSANRNGQVGTAITFLIEKDRFVVKVQGEEFALKADNLRVVSNDGNESNAESTTPLPLSVDNLVNALFRKGMLFKGIISVPGLIGERREYQLLVESSFAMDEMDRPAGILARHKAYDDEQYVWIHVDKRKIDELSIHFADGETQCNGTWNRKKGQFEGSVRQLIPTEDGGSIYYAQDKVTHTFNLSPTTALYPNGIAASLDTNANEETETSEENEKDLNTEQIRWEQDLISNTTQSIANLRHEMDQLSFDLVDRCENLCIAIEPLPIIVMMVNEDLQEPVSRLVSQVRCKELLAVDSLAAEKSCALFRRWANLLDTLTFASVEERGNILASLKDKGMTRARAHKYCDDRKERARQIVATWSTLSSMTRSSDRPSGDDMTRFLVMCSRLDRNFTRFDEALRRAEERLTDDDFQKWIVSNETVNDDDDAICTICHVPLHDGDTADDQKALCLPCSHRFHDECLREWLRHHSQCPVCRLELRCKGNGMDSVSS
jgi:hypothetical protein